MLSSCESRVLNVGTPLMCRVVKSSKSGSDDTYHLGASGSERFVIVRRPVFSKIIGVEKYAIFSSYWRENMKFTLTHEKLSHETTDH